MFTYLLTYLLLTVVYRDVQVVLPATLPARVSHILLSGPGKQTASVFALYRSNCITIVRELM